MVRRAISCEVGTLWEILALGPMVARSVSSLLVRRVADLLEE